MRKYLFVVSFLFLALPALAADRFSRGQGGVVDSLTGLVWQRNYYRFKRFTYLDAQRYCDALREGGFADWRLPTIKELSSLVDVTRYTPNADPTLSMDIGFFWSDTVSASNAYSSSYVFSYISPHGYVGMIERTDRNNVRCVRSEKH